LPPQSRKQHFATIQCDQTYLYILPFSNKTPPGSKSHGINYYGCQPRGHNKEPGWDPTLYLSCSTGPLAYISSLEFLSFDRQSAGTYAYPFGSIEFFIDASSDVITSSFPNVSACCNCKEARRKKFSQ